MPRFEIYAGYMDELLVKFNKIQKKAKKYGNTVTLNVVDSRMVEIAPAPHMPAVPYKFVTVDVEGTAKINNWEFVATLEHKGESGNVIRKAITDLELPESFRTCDPWCEHCNKIRNRKDTFVVHNIVTGEFKQVAKTCLVDYTNGLSIEMATWNIAIRDLFEEASQGFGGSGVREPSYSRLDDVLALAIETVKIFGYKKSRDEYGEYNPNNTKSRVCEFYRYFFESFWLNDMEKKEIRDRVERYAFDYDTDEIKAEVAKCKDWVMPQEAKSDYMSNLQVLCSDTYIENRDYGLVVSVIPAYFKAMETEQAIKKNRDTSKSEFVGEIGKRSEFTLTFVKDVTFEVASYSWNRSTELMHIYTFVDDNENVYVWKTTNTFGTEFEKVVIDKDGTKRTYTAGFREADIGDTVTFKATLKDHSEYKGIKQNVLTRCKVVKITTEDGKEFSDKVQKIYHCESDCDVAFENLFVF